MSSLALLCLFDTWEGGAGGRGPCLTVGHVLSTQELQDKTAVAAS